MNQSPANACRDLHRLLHRTKGVLLPIPIDVCAVHIKRRKPIRRFVVWWPMLKLSSWVHYFLKHKPQLILGSFHANDAKHWRELFKSFWEAYRLTNSDHPLFQTDFDVSCCVPYALHGDEGRGLAHKPYLVIAWQPIIGCDGMDVCNDSKYLSCTLICGN